MQEVAQLISTVGFPIVLCLLFFFRMEKSLDLVKESLNNNTQVMQQLVNNQKGE